VNTDRAQPVGFQPWLARGAGGLGDPAFRAALSRTRAAGEPVPGSASGLDAPLLAQVGHPAHLFIETGARHEGHLRAVSFAENRAGVGDSGREGRVA
jgi:hypothetical protein